MLNLIHILNEMYKSKRVFSLKFAINVLRSAIDT